MKTKISEIEYHFNQQDMGNKIVIHRNRRARSYKYTFERDVQLAKLWSKYGTYTRSIFEGETYDETYCAIDVF